MPLNKPLVQTLATLKLETAKQELVLANYPDATIHYYNGFQSKSVNKTYTAYDFDRNSYSVSFIPYAALELDYEGIKHTIKVHTQPRKSRICYLGYEYTSHKNIIRFSRVAINENTSILY